MDFSQDHFALFGLPRRYSIDLPELEKLYRDVQTRVHPDKHVNLSDAERRLAMQWSTQVNEVYQTLRQLSQEAWPKEFQSESIMQAPFPAVKPGFINGGAQISRGIFNIRFVLFK